MDRTQLLQQFDALAETPAAVEKLRNFIFHLATRGKLAPQNSTDESATGLAERIITLGQKIGKLQKIKLPTPEIAISKEDKKFNLPEGWAWAKLGDLCIKLGAGSTPLGGKRVYQEKGIKFLRSQNVWNVGLHLEDVALIDPAVHEDMGSTCVEPGDVLLNITGASIGRCAIVPEDFDEANVSQHVAIVRLADKVIRRFIHLIIIAPDFQSQIMRVQVGVSREGLSMKNLKEFVVALPPLAEQRRIVAKVEELLALCDELEARQTSARESRTRLVQSALDHLTTAKCESDFRKHATFVLQNSNLIMDSAEDLRHGILALAVQGRLLPQNAQDEPVGKLFQRGFKLPGNYTRRPKRAKETVIELPVDIFPQIPKSWKYATVQELNDINAILGFEDGNHGSQYPRKTDFGNDGIRFVTAAQINHGRIDWQQVPKLASDKAASLVKGWARGGDVLLTHNASVGDVAFAEENAGAFLLGTSVTFYRLHPEALESRFVYHVFQSLVWQKQLAAVMQQTTRNQVSIQKQAFFRIPVPPLAEQKRIVAKVDELMHWCDALEARLTAAQTAAANLLDAILHQILTAPKPRK